MAKMGTGELARKKGSGETQLPDAGFPILLPVNLITSPIESAPVTAIGVGSNYNLGSSIMRDGFTTETGLLPSPYNLNG